jgi:hypothetical protein
MDAEAGMSRNDQKKLAQHRRIAELLETEPLYVITRALQNVPRKRETTEGGARAAVERWNALLRTHDVDGLRRALLGDDDESRAMRNNSVFGGIVPRDEVEA